LKVRKIKVLDHERLFVIVFENKKRKKYMKYMREQQQNNKNIRENGLNSDRLL